MFATSSRNRSALSSDPYVARHVNSRLLGCRTSVGRHPSHISRPITAERRSGSWCPVRWPMIGMRGVDIASVAKAYRLLKAIMNTAVDDGLIRRNPCRIKGAGQEKSPERPVLTIRQVFDLADVIAPRYRALILLAVFGSLRWGELAALRRRHIDLTSGTVRVEL